MVENFTTREPRNVTSRTAEDSMHCLHGLKCLKRLTSIFCLCVCVCLWCIQTYIVSACLDSAVVASNETVGMFLHEMK